MASEREHRAAIDRMTKRIRESSGNRISADEARDKAVKVAKRHERVIKRER